MSHVIHVCGLDVEDLGIASLQRRGAKRIVRDLKRVARRLEKLKAPAPFGVEFLGAMDDWMRLHEEVGKRFVGGVIHAAGGEL